MRAKLNLCDAMCYALHKDFNQFENLQVGLSGWREFAKLIFTKLTERFRDSSFTDLFHLLLVSLLLTLNRFHTLLWCFHG